MGKRSDPPPPPPAPGRFNDAFAKLRERLPVAPADAEAAAPPPPSSSTTAAPEPTPPAPAAARPLPASAPSAQTPAGPPRAVVRLERKGRGGKEATIIEKLALPPAALARWADELKRGLGCGGGVEAGAIALHGDQRERVRRWLEARGVRKVTLG
jgi:translation initiation factor 1